MSRRLVVLVTCLLAAAPAVAQRDRGKDLLPKLMAGPTAAAAAGTVRILADGREVALGTVVSADGLILTKASELRGDLLVRLRGGDATYDAKLLGVHKPTDLALLKIEAKDLKPVQFTTAPGTVGGWVASPGLGSDPVGVGVLSAGVRVIDPESSGRGGREPQQGLPGHRVRRNPRRRHDGGGGRRPSTRTARRSASSRRGTSSWRRRGRTISQRTKDLPSALDTFRPGDTVTVKYPPRRRGRTDGAGDAGRRGGTIERSDFQNTLGNQLSGRRTGFPAVLQHDTPLKPSDVGGPLVDLTGKVLGLNIARAGRVETWALPADVLNPVLEELKAGKYRPVKK